MSSPKGRRSDAVRKGNLVRRNPAYKDIRATNKAEVVRMRMEGNSYRVIAEKLNLSLGAAHELCSEALNELQGEGRELAIRLRAEQLYRIDTLSGRLMRLVMNDKLRVVETRTDGSVLELQDFEVLTRLTGSLVKLFERQAKLMGLDSPTQLNLVEKPQLTWQMIAEMQEKRKSGQDTATASPASARAA